MATGLSAKELLAGQIELVSGTVTQSRRSTLWVDRDSQGGTAVTMDGAESFIKPGQRIRAVVAIDGAYRIAVKVRNADANTVITTIPGKETVPGVINAAFSLLRTKSTIATAGLAVIASRPAGRMDVEDTAKLGRPIRITPRGKRQPALGASDAC